MPDGLVIVRNGWLVPGDPATQELVSRYTPGQALRVKMTGARNVRQHRLYWGLVQKIAEAVDVPAETVSAVLKLKAGAVETYTDKHGNLCTWPRSIAFDRMDQAEFAEFFKRAAQVVIEQWLPGMKAEELRKEVEAMLT